jgi:hypothetical protein
VEKTILAKPAISSSLRSVPVKPVPAQRPTPSRLITYCVRAERRATMT